MPYFEDVNYETAKEFLEALRLTNPKWLEWGIRPWRIGNGWYFRGQGNADWLLRPSAWRPNDQLIESKVLQTRDRLIDRLNLEERISELSSLNAENLEQAIQLTVLSHAEYILVHEFVEYANELGLNLPNHPELPGSLDFINMFLDSLVNDPASSSKMTIFWSNPIFALAQHHKIPTRLLDWTTSPLAAAYFAAESALDENSTYLAVFALPSGSEHAYKTLRIPPYAAQNEYMRAQRGLFTLDFWNDHHYLSSGSRLPLPESIHQTNVVRAAKKKQIYAGNFTHESIIPKKLILPTSQAEELLRLLWIEGITKAHLMPTFDNLTESLKFKWRMIEKDQNRNFQSDGFESGDSLHTDS